MNDEGATFQTKPAIHGFACEPFRNWVGFALAPALLFLALELLVVGRYGIFRDELYYAASTEHLDWGYVDHPPFSIAVLALVRAVLGDSLLALRLLPALCGGSVVFAAGWFVRELGGGRCATLVAGLSAVFTTYLGICHFYSMNALDLAVWSLVLCLLLRVLREGTLTRWAWLGVVLGIGLQNKVSVLFLGAGLAVALVATPHRALLRTRGPWIAAGVAALLFLPHVLWQAANDWPTLEFVRQAKEHKMLAVGPLDFFLGQLLSMNPGNAPLWMAGLVGLFTVGSLREGRPLGWVFVTVALILILSRDAKPYYLAAAYPPLLAAGATLAERWLGRGRWVLVPLVLGIGAVMTPLALPVLSPERYVSYAEWLGFQAPASERHAPTTLPQHFADQFGWAEMVDAVEEAYASLSPEEQGDCLVYGQNYGQAGAVDVLGGPRGLPPAISGHNSYWLWGLPSGRAGSVLVIIGGRREDHLESFDEVTEISTTTNRWGMPYEQNLTVFVARKPRRPLGEIWPLLKRYI